MKVADRVYWWSEGQNWVQEVQIIKPAHTLYVSVVTAIVFTDVLNGTRWKWGEEKQLLVDNYILVMYIYIYMCVCAYDDVFPLDPGHGHLSHAHRLSNAPQQFARPLFVIWIIIKKKKKEKKKARHGTPYCVYCYNAAFIITVCISIDTISMGYLFFNITNHTTSVSALTGLKGKQTY